MTWTDDAACRGRVHLFFAPNRNSDGAPLGGGFDFGPALNLCRNECPVRIECRAWAIEAGDIDCKGRAVHGVVAGLAPPTKKPGEPADLTKRCELESCGRLFTGNANRRFCSEECSLTSRALTRRAHRLRQRMAS